MENHSRILPEGVHAIHLRGKRFVQYDPSVCDPKLLKKHLLYFSDERLEGLAVCKADIVAFAKFMGTSQRRFLNQYAATAAIEDLEEVLSARGIEHLFEVEREPSSTAEVHGALTTRDAVQAEIDALRSRFGIEQEVPARFVERFSDIPGEENTDAAFGFQGLPFLPAPYSMEIVFADEYLTYPKPYRDYLLLHEFAHCLQVLGNWPYCGQEEEHHDDSFREACAKLGIEPEREGAYYPAGSYRVTCQSCGDTKYVQENETMRTLDMPMDRFVDIFECPHCHGEIDAERTEAPVFIIGDDVCEVAPNGDCAAVGTIKRPRKPQAQLHNEYDDIVYAAASYMDFRRYQAGIERICLELEETWELYDFEDWLLGSGGGRLDMMLAHLSDACDAVEEAGDEAYSRMMVALMRGQRIPASDQMGLFGFEIGKVRLADLDKEECDLFAMDKGEYNVSDNFELLCGFLKEYFDAGRDGGAESDSGDPSSYKSNDEDGKPKEARDEEKAHLQVRAEVSDGSAWRRFVVPANTLFAQLHYSLAVAFDRVDDITEGFFFRIGGRETLSQRESFQEKVIDKADTGEAFEYVGCGGMGVKVTVEGFCRLNPSLPPFYPMVIGSSQDASSFELNCLSASLTLSSKEKDKSPDDSEESLAAYMDLAAQCAASSVDPDMVTLLWED